MRKKLFVLCMVAVMSLYAWAETPKECYKKHPNALCLFFKTPKALGTLENFDIERIAFYRKDAKVAIKTTQREKDIVKNISGTMDGDEYLIGAIFEDGSALAIDNDLTYMMYMSTKGEPAVFVIDEYKHRLHDNILKENGKWYDDLTE